MKSFNQYITEVFDNPYKWRGGHVAKGSITPNNSGIPEEYRFKSSDGGTIEVTANHFWIDSGEPFGEMKTKKAGHTIAIEFAKNMSYDMTGEGDAMRILATVLDIINDIIKKHEPAMLYFSGDKGGKGIERKGESGRVGAYTAIVKRFAGKAGYTSITQDTKDKVNFQLVKK